MPTIPASKAHRPLLLALMLALMAACDYSTEVKKSVQRVLREDFGKYHFFATPAGNFGIGTMYLKAAGAQQPGQIGNEALVAIPETYFASNVANPERSAILERLFVNGKIGKFTVSEKLVSGVALDVAVPGIAGALTGGGSLDLKKGVTVELQAGETAVRKLNWTELARARNDGKIAADIAQHLESRDVMIAMNDIVIRGYTAVVTLDANANVGLKAELDKAVAGGAVKLPSGSTKFSSGQNGTYRIEVTDPVVVAVLFREIPAGVLEADTDKWPSGSLSDALANRLRELVAQARARAK